MPMKNESSLPRLQDWAVIVNPDRDDVAVAKVFIPTQTTLIVEGPLRGAEAGETITIRADIAPGHRFAIRSVPPGAWVRQYGHPFARSKGLEPGDPVSDATVVSEVPQVSAGEIEMQSPRLPAWEGPYPSFEGFHRSDGQVGTRNWVLIVPVSMCAAHEASQIALQAELRGIYTREQTPNVDGVVAIPHDGGCGCPNAHKDATIPGTYEATLRMLAQHVRHPNVSAAILIELGCEKTNHAAFDSYFGTQDLGRLYGKPVQRLSIQGLGGTRATVERGLALLPDLLAAANRTQRAPAPASALALGLECGGSDAFSGITANPALGEASDLLVRAGGRSVIGEVPEFFGAAHLFAARAANRQLAAGIFEMLERYGAYAARAGHSMTENPSPGNREGGLLNITIKSLGALAKGGSAPVQGALNYGEWVWDRKDPGVYLLNTPGYDQLSVPGLVGAGCQVVCFTTGRGTGIGNAIAPVIKISSNTPLYTRMQADMDVNAGAILTEGISLPEMGRIIFGQVLRAASGEETKAEGNGHREFALWNIEGLWL
jgi:altronate hydrolase